MRKWSVWIEVEVFETELESPSPIDNDVIFGQAITNLSDDRNIKIKHIKEVKPSLADIFSEDN